MLDIISNGILHFYINLNLTLLQFCFCLSENVPFLSSIFFNFNINNAEAFFIDAFVVLLQSIVTFQYDSYILIQLRYLSIIFFLIFNSKTSKICFFNTLYIFLLYYDIINQYTFPITYRWFFLFDLPGHYLPLLPYFLYFHLTIFRILYIYMKDILDTVYISEGGFALS